MLLVWRISDLAFVEKIYASYAILFIANSKQMNKIESKSIGMRRETKMENESTRLATLSPGLQMKLFIPKLN